MPAKKQKGNSLLGNVRPYFENFTNKVKIKEERQSRFVIV